MARAIQSTSREAASKPRRRRCDLPAGGRFSVRGVPRARTHTMTPHDAWRAPMYRAFPAARPPAGTVSRQAKGPAQCDRRRAVADGPSDAGPRNHSGASLATRNPDRRPRSPRVTRAAGHPNRPPAAQRRDTRRRRPRRERGAVSRRPAGRNQPGSRRCRQKTRLEFAMRSSTALVKGCEV